MKLSLQIDRLRRLLWCILAFVIRSFTSIKKGRVFCWSYNFNQYGCNPKYITEYILNNNPEDFEIVWGFNKNVDVSQIDKRIIIVYNQTIRCLLYMYTSEFVITNSRNDRYGDYYFKKKGQKYVMTWHGSTPLKKIEKDAEIQLGPRYIHNSEVDSMNCDLMLSNSAFYTNLIRTAFMYNGEILQTGIPRNDIFFDDDKKRRIRESIYHDFDIPQNKKIIMYAPTFRDDHQISHFIFNWKRLIDEIDKKFGKEHILFIRLHPNCINDFNIDDYIDDSCMRNMCFYHDMQELLCITDILVTDYSSTMFEMALLNKVCFLYSDDLETYSRDFYFDLRKLPFSFAGNEDELVSNIQNFDDIRYKEKLKAFCDNEIAISENGQASKNVVDWMVNHKMV